MEDGVYGQFSHTTQLGGYPEHRHLPRSRNNQSIHQSAALSGIHKPVIGKEQNICAHARSAPTQPLDQNLSAS